MKRKINEEQKKEVILMHQQNVPLKEIYQKFNIGQTTLYRYLKCSNIKKNNKRRRKIRFDDNFFETIDNEVKAYFLGLIFADGCIDSIKNRRRIRINLSEKDKDILEKFKKAIQYSGDIKIYTRTKDHIINNKIINSQSYVTLYFASPKMYQDLINKGCTERKSLILRWPKNLPNSLIHHFLRGYIDGDGWITIREKYKAAICGLVSSHIFCKQTKELVENLLNITCTIKITQNTDKVSRLDIRGNKNFLKFTNWLYKDATIYLDRKYNKYLEGKKIILDKWKHIGVQYDLATTN